MKKTLIYGIGISGIGAAESLLDAGKPVILYNDTPKDVDPTLAARLAAHDGEVVIGGGLYLLPRVSEIILSPSVTQENSLVVAAKAQGIPCIAEVEYASRLFPGHIAGITGTNGKTTTTTLVGAFFQTLAAPSAVGGNIGLAMSRVICGLTPESWLAAELSSFQLEGIVTMRPKVAVVLNLTPDHLEYHHTMEAYGRAKQRIFMNQDASDYTVLNYDDPLVRSWAAHTRGQLCYFSREKELERGVFLRDGQFVIRWGGEALTVCHKDELHIFGGHNEENVLAALACAYFAGVTPDDMRQVLRSFQPLEHRLEYVETIAGVPYYNDSKATNTDSAVKALQAFPQGHVVLLAGGYDKGTPLAELMQLVRERADALVLFGAARARFAAAAAEAGVTNITQVETLAQALTAARQLAVPPQVVLFSPACSSYDQFPNFVVRGRTFKELVRKLATDTPGREESL